MAFTGLDLFGTPCLETKFGTLPGSEARGTISIRALKAFSVGLALLTLCNCCTEWWATQSEWHSSYVAATNVQGERRLLLDVTFPHLECEGINIDIKNAGGLSGACESDSTGCTEDTFVQKFSVLNGVELPYESPPAGQCLPCYEASSAAGPGHCCNTCQSLISTFFDHRLERGRDFSTYPQCQRGGCRLKASVLFGGSTGAVAFSSANPKSSLAGSQHRDVHPNILLAQQWNISHIVHSASLTPAFGGSGEAIPLNVPRVGELVEFGIDNVVYHARVIPVEIHENGNHWASHRNHVNLETRPAIIRDAKRRPRYAVRPALYMRFASEHFVIQMHRKSTSCAALASQLIISLGGVLAFFNIVAILVQRSVPKKAVPMQRLSDTVAKVIASRSSATTAFSDTEIVAAEVFGIF